MRDLERLHAAAVRRQKALVAESRDLVARYLTYLDKLTRYRRLAENLEQKVRVLDARTD